MDNNPIIEHIEELHRTDENLENTASLSVTVVGTGDAEAPELLFSIHSGDMAAVPEDIQNIIYGMLCSAQYGFQAKPDVMSSWLKEVSVDDETMELMSMEPEGSA